MASIEETIRHLNGRARVLATLADSAANAAWHGYAEEHDVTFWHGMHAIMQELTTFFVLVTKVIPADVLNLTMPVAAPSAEDDRVAKKGKPKKRNRKRGKK